LALWGVHALEKLDGMFAFAAYDTVTGDLILAHDAFGEKPIYFMDLADGGLAFASEIQALECLPEFDATVDLSAMSEVLCFQYIGAPRSISLMQNKSLFQVINSTNQFRRRRTRSFALATWRADPGYHFADPSAPITSASHSRGKRHG
jgi:asparagine synthetase B (glutamine-hydrolysing)